MRQQREVLRKEKETAEKIAARAFAQSYLADLVPTVFGTLSDNGYFFDPVERGIYTMTQQAHMLLFWVCFLQLHESHSSGLILLSIYRFIAWMTKSVDPDKLASTEAS